ncbi:tetratricopeptide repeat protein (plasmid) [Deinococcus radiomollis]|uniref:tetratricopeptide repeat protein n=1 Tax=Deinococcus radiomollis TaxID=468916 RepID=UPI003892199A
MKLVNLIIKTLAVSVIHLTLLFILSVSSTAQADNTAGMKYYNAKQYQQAYKELYADAMKGNAEAAFNLGFMYQNDSGVLTDYLQAVKWFKASANLGDTEAMKQLGLMYHALGFKLPGNGYSSALSWYMKAALKNNASGQYKVGNFYQYGWRINTNIHQAINWYRKSADQGDKDAQYALGNVYKYSDSIKQDYKEAAVLYRKAVLQGQVEAQASLGQLYEQGQGVPKDLKLALQWCQKAADAHNDNGIDCVARLNL